MIRHVVTSKPILKIGTDLKAEDIHALIVAGFPLHWDYCGLHGILPLAVMENAWATIRDHLAMQRLNDGRTKTPPAVFEFHWRQTIPLEDPSTSHRLDSTGRPISPLPPRASTGSDPSSGPLS